MTPHSYHLKNYRDHLLFHTCKVRHVISKIEALMAEDRVSRLHPTIAILLIKIVIFPDYSVVFTCSKVINAFKR